MTKKTTIASLSAKVDSFVNIANSQFSTLRGQFGSFLGLSPDGKRDTYDIYNYPKSLSGDTGFRQMYQYSRRQGVANRITWGLSKRCWRDGFEIYDSSEEDAKQVLVDEVQMLKRAGFVKKIEQADILNRIGRFSVLFVGVPDGKDPSEPLDRTSLGSDWLDKLYFVAYPYDGAQISSQVSDPTDQRFGLPEKYTLQRSTSSSDTKDAEIKAITAHWTRVVHLNENALDSDIEGMGALEPVFNAILDIEKATGGSSEAYFRNARQKIAYEIDPQFANDVLTNEKSKKSFNTAAEKFTDDWQDHTMAAGAKVKSIVAPLADPLPTVKASLWTVSSYTGLPIRVLTGEGSGQLAGSEDQLAYDQIIMDRQNLVCSGWVSVALEVLERAGMIELPEDYEIRFPIKQASTEKEKAEIGNKKADTIQKLASAKSSAGGDGIDIVSAFAECGLKDVEVEDVDIDDIDESIDDVK